MRVQVGGVRLFFDVDGAKLVPDGPWMRERPTVLLLHPGPGFDHGLFKTQLGPWLAAGTQVVYLDLRGADRSDRGPPEEHRLERWADDVRELCDALRIERPVVLGLGLAPSSRSGTPPATRRIPPRSSSQPRWRGSCPSARSRCTSGAEARGVAERYYGEMDEQAFADFLRVCFPLLSSYALTSEVIARAD